MCGIFGLVLDEPIKISKVFRVLEKLEVHQYRTEPNPVGGYGAGIAVLMDDGSILVEKVGSGKESPAKRLAESVDVSFASIILGHVRMPLPEYMKTAKFKETAQPYIARKQPELAIASVHNGSLENYKELEKGLSKGHTFESEKIGLIDSEVVPHVFEEILYEKADMDDALYEFLYRIKGPNAIGLLQVGEDSTFLHLIHKGKTRGLSVWTNDKGEVAFCSRKEPLIEQLGGFLSERKFKEKIYIKHREDAGLKLSFSGDLKVKK
jgi:glucosamine 6-phosphate synthetase-like amidotransferase/phosphosugar isomerase protein